MLCSNNVELQVDEKLNSKEFKALWSWINAKSVYVVDFDTDELIQKSIALWTANLSSKDLFQSRNRHYGRDWVKGAAGSPATRLLGKSPERTMVHRKLLWLIEVWKYDLVGKLVEGQG